MVPSGSTSQTKAGSKYRSSNDATTFGQSSSSAGDSPASGRGALHPWRIGSCATSSPEKSNVSSARSSAPAGVSSSSCPMNRFARFAIATSTPSTPRAMILSPNGSARISR